MKVLFKKLNKVSKTKKLFYFLSLFLYLATFIYFIIGILHLKGIENVIRIIITIIFAIWFFIYLLSGLLSIIAKKTKTFIVLTIITLLLCPIFGISSYYINKVYGSLNSMVKDELKYTTNLIALKNTKFKSTSIIGMIESEEDIEGHKLAKKLMNKNKLTNKVKYYEDYHSLILALYNKEIGACFVSSNFSVIFDGQNFESEEGEEEIPLSERVNVLYEYSENLTNQDSETLSTSKSKNLTEPFTVLIMGVDSTIDGLSANQAFNGDTLIMVTFNPTTLTATMFSLPRDLYVPIACNHNRYNKINSSAAYGSSCVINTIQQLTGIDIDYYLKMNFTGVVQLVDALGGVTVDVEEPDFYYDEKHKGQVCEQNSQRQFDNGLVCMDTGIQTLNGEQALAYARCRHLYAMSDIARNQHQQQIIEAAAQKLKTIRSVSDFEKILNAISNNLETNITPEQIMSFYNVGKDMLLSSNKNSTALSIKKTYLAYYSLPVYLPNSEMYTSALGYWQGSLDAIVDLMKENLGISKPKTIKTFSISYNEDYTTPLVGYGIATGEKLERMPNLIGQNREYVENWCTERNINCKFNDMDYDAPEGQIVDQNQHEGVLVKSIKIAEFAVSTGKNSSNINKDDKEDKDDKTNEEESSEDDNKENNKDEDNNTNDGDKTDDKDNNQEETPTTPETPVVPGLPSEEEKEPSEPNNETN